MSRNAMPPLPFIHQMISLLAQRFSFSAKVHIPISSLLRPKHLSITRKYSPHYFSLWGGNLQMQPPVGSWSTPDLFKGLRAYLNWNHIFDPTLSNLHPSFGNSDHARRYINKLRLEFFPEGTGFKGEYP